MVLVTGVNGFVGKHLVRELNGRGSKVAGIGHSGLADPEIADLLTTYETCDLVDPTIVSQLRLEEVEAVVNLAGLARVSTSFKNPERYERVNVAVLANIGKLLLKQAPKARLVAVSTGAVYNSDQPMPLTEKSRTLSVGSPYAMSKLLMEKAAFDLLEKGLDVIIARPFNHCGPGQAEGFLIPDLYQKIMTAKESGKPFTVGNLATKRDYTDVRDIVRAYADLVLASNLSFYIYNVCSGTSRSGKEVLEALLYETDMKNEISIVVDQSLIRPNDPADLYGSYDRLKKETGWSPSIPFNQTIYDFIANKRL